MSPDVRAAATRVVSSVPHHPEKTVPTHPKEGFRQQPPLPLTQDRLRQLDQVNLSWKAHTAQCVIADWHEWKAVGDALEELAAAEAQGLLALDELVALVGSVDASWLKLTLELNRCLEIYRFNPLMRENLTHLRAYLHQMMGTVHDIYHVVTWGFQTSKDQAYHRMAFSLSSKQREIRVKHDNATMQYALDEVNRDPSLFGEWRWADGAKHDLRKQDVCWPVAAYSADLEIRSEPPLEKNIAMESECAQGTEDTTMAEPLGDESLQVPYADPQPREDVPDPMNNGFVPDTTTTVDEFEIDDEHCLLNDVDSDSCSEEWAVVSSTADTVIVDQDDDEDGQSVWSLNDSMSILIEDQDGESFCSLGDSIPVTIRKKCVNLDLDRLWHEYFCQSSSLLDNWQRLLKDLGQTGDFGSIRKCKNAMQGIWVDPSQFIAAERKPEDVRFYKSERHLAASLGDLSGLVSLQTSSRHPALSSMKAKVRRHVHRRSRACAP